MMVVHFDKMSVRVPMKDGDTIEDIEDRLIVLFSSEWMMRRIIDDYKDKDVTFIAAVQPGRKAMN